MPSLEMFLLLLCVLFASAVSDTTTKPIVKEDKDDTTDDIHDIMNFFMGIIIGMCFKKKIIIDSIVIYIIIHIITSIIVILIYIYTIEYNEESIIQLFDDISHISMFTILGIINGNIISNM